MRKELLKDIAEIIAGQSPPSDTYNKTGEGVPFFQGMADYGDKFPEIRNWCRQPTKISLPNDILISVRAPVGPVNINNVEACIGRGLSAIRAKENYSYEYLYYFLKANEKQISNLGVGSTFNAITQKELGKINISIPETLADQIKIATVLSKADALIKQRKENIDLLDEFLKSTFLKMFSDPSRNEKSFALGIIRDVVRDVKYGTSKSADSDGSYPYLRMNNITQTGYMDYSDLKYINIKDSEKEKYVVRKGDLLFNRTNSKELVGKTGVFSEEQEMIIAGYLIRVRTNEKANPWFLWGYLNSLHGKQTLLGMCKAIVGMANINAQELQKIKILIPPIELQNRFAEIVEKAEALKRQLKNNLIELENLYGSLSQKAFKGELEIDTPKIVQNVESEMLELEYSRSIGMLAMSDDIPEGALENFEKTVEGLTVKIEEKRELINRLTGNASRQEKKETENNLKANNLPPKIEEDKRYGDPFEVDEETAKKQGVKFYKDWRKLHPEKKKSKITWDKVSTEQVANWMKVAYTGFHFTSEMLIRFLMDEHVTFPDYYSSEELKKNPKANDVDDLKTLIFSALNNENPFLKLEQVFYNPEAENINLILRDEDFELIKDRSREERTGVYLRIAK